MVMSANGSKKLQLVNPVYDNASLAYKGNQLDYDKLSEWENVYHDELKNFNAQNLTALNFFNESIEQGVKSNKIRMFSKNDLTSIVKLGKYKQVFYHLSDDRTIELKEYEGTLNLKETIFKNNDNANTIGLYAISQFGLYNFSPYFGILFNEFDTEKGIYSLFG
jgi:hypothetical protein